MAKSTTKSMTKKKPRVLQETSQEPTSFEATNKKSTNKVAANKVATNKVATNKVAVNKKASVVADGRAWQKLSSPPLARALAAEEVSRLLALLNGAEVVAAGRSWRCRARQLFSATQAQEPVPPQGRWSLLLSLGGRPCLCRTELPSAFRETLEAMSEPCRLEELPASVALGLLSLALSPLLQELFVAPCRLVEHGVGVGKKVCAKEEVALDITLLPVAQRKKKEKEETGEAEEGEISRDPAAMRLQVFLAASDLEAVSHALRVARRRRRYPPNLHTTWQLDGGGTSLSLEEFRALKEGDVLLLA